MNTERFPWLIVVLSVFVLASSVPVVAAAQCSAYSISRFGGKEYLFCPDTRNWNSASTRCQNLGAGTWLVRIDSDLEQQHVLSVIGANETWIGAQRDGSTANWVWRDGTNDVFYNNGTGPVLYAFWDRGIPNGGNNFGAAIWPSHDGRWEDSDNSGLFAPTRAFMCERVDPAAIACGNGIVSAGEGCDDGGTVAGDGCSATCTLERGYYCSRSGAFAP